MRGGQPPREAAPPANPRVPGGQKLPLSTFGGPRGAPGDGLMSSHTATAVQAPVVQSMDLPQQINPELSPNPAEWDEDIIVREFENWVHTFQFKPADKEQIQTVTGVIILSYSPIINSEIKEVQP